MLSLKTAQFDQIHDQVRQDGWLRDNLHKLPPHALISYIADHYHLGEAQAEEVLKMVNHDAPPVANPMSLRNAQRQEYPQSEVDAWATSAETHIKSQVGEGAYKSPSEARGALQELIEQSGVHLKLSDEAFARFWDEVRAKLIERGVIQPEGNVVDQPGTKTEPAAPSDATEQQAFEDMVAKLPTQTKDDIANSAIDAWQKLRKIRDPVKRKQLEQHLQSLVQRLGQLNQLRTAAKKMLRMSRAAQAQDDKKITIPATADHAARTMTIPKKDEEAPDPTKVVINPTSPEAKKDTVDQSIDDTQKTRQEQLTNSFRAMEVVLHDFVNAMYGLELNREYMGKLLEAIIDKGSDLAAQQTAETVKQLASPFLGE